MMGIKRFSRRLWMWIVAVALAVTLLIVSLVRGWNFAALVFAIAAIIAGIFAVQEWRASEAVDNVRGIIVDTTKNTVIITWDPLDTGQIQ